MNLDSIKAVLQNPNSGWDDLIHCCEIIQQHGDIVVIKFDGERVVNRYSIFITFAQEKKLDMIRQDSDDLGGSLRALLERYVSTYIK